MASTSGHADQCSSSWSKQSSDAPKCAWNLLLVTTIERAGKVLVTERTLSSSADNRFVKKKFGQPLGWHSFCDIFELDTRSEGACVSRSWLRPRDRPSNSARRHCETPRKCTCCAYTVHALCRDKDTEMLSTLGRSLASLLLHGCVHAACMVSVLLTMWRSETSQKDTIKLQLPACRTRQVIWDHTTLCMVFDMSLPWSTRVQELQSYLC